MSRNSRVRKLERMADKSAEQKRISKRKVFLAFGKTEAERDEKVLAWETEQGITEDDEVFIIHVRSVEPDQNRFEDLLNGDSPKKPSKSGHRERMRPSVEPKPLAEANNALTIADGGDIVDAKSGDRISLQQLTRFKKANDEGKMFHQGVGVDIDLYPKVIDRDY
jgi:hypothetical protein